MLRSVFTLDYEIHGNGDGSPFALMVEPTRRMLDQFDRYGAKLTILADVAEILKFKEYKEESGHDKFHYDAIAEQLCDAIRRGHDVQLHLHASYFNARFERGSWLQDWSEYNFAELEPQRLNQVIGIGKSYLEALLRPVNPSYCCSIFRAANWSMCPSRNVVRALADNGFAIDTSVFKYGRRQGLVTFDYSDAPSSVIPWRASEDDVSKADANGRIYEYPIYSESRWLGAFLTPHRLFRAWTSRQHRFPRGANTPVRNLLPTANVRREAGRKPNLFRRKFAWKADFNQCSSSQLIAALCRAEAMHRGNNQELPFVLIGHSKLFSRFNEWSLQSFLKFISRHPDRFGFAKFSDFAFHQRHAPVS
jgi:hypothetical protein